MAPANEKQQAHDLIERLAPSQISAVVHLLEVMIDPVARAISNAPVDDEPVTEEEAREIAAARASLDRGEAFLTRKCWPSSALPPKTSRAWAALRSTPTSRVDMHGQERSLDRPGQGPAPRHRSSPPLSVFSTEAGQFREIAKRSNQN